MLAGRLLWRNLKVNKLIIVGAGGHGKVVYDVAESMGVFSELYFLDDDRLLLGDFYKSKVIGSSREVNRYLNDYGFIVAIGDNAIREKILLELKSIDATIEVLVHSKALISSTVNIGVGTVVMPNVIINADSSIGDGVVLNSGCIIEHDCKVDDFCHISPNTTICGTVNVGKNSWIGAGAMVINNLNICENVVIGAGSVVLRNIDKSGTYVGVVK
mgnify:CR=1 FL=1